jgi:hypothetical protein
MSNFGQGGLCPWRDTNTRLQRDRYVNPLQESFDARTFSIFPYLLLLLLVGRY